MNDFQPHTLVLVRHSKASRDAASDRERPLTERGVRMAQDIGRQLDARLGTVDLMLVSPAIRAQQTADAMAVSLHVAERRIREEIYTSGPGGWLTVLQDLPEEVGSAVVVGHEPTVSSLAYALHAPSVWQGATQEPEAVQPERADALAAQIAFGVSTATAVILAVPGPWSRLAPGAAQITDVIVAQR